MDIRNILRRRKEKKWLNGGPFWDQGNNLITKYILDYMLRQPYQDLGDLTRSYYALVERQIENMERYPQMGSQLYRHAGYHSIIRWNNGMETRMKKQAARIEGHALFRMLAPYWESASYDVWWEKNIPWQIRDRGMTRTDIKAHSERMWRLVVSEIEWKKPILEKITDRNCRYRK